jgi:hypothetical protein
LLSKQNSGRHRRPEFFCAFGRRPANRKPGWTALWGENA